VTASQGSSRKHRTFGDKQIAVLVELHTQLLWLWQKGRMSDWRQVLGWRSLSSARKRSVRKSSSSCRRCPGPSTPMSRSANGESSFRSWSLAVSLRSIAGDMTPEQRRDPGIGEKALEKIGTQFALLWANVEGAASPESATTSERISTDRDVQGGRARGEGAGLTQGRRRAAQCGWFRLIRES